MTESYDAFAGVYDALMDNIPYDEWVSYICALLHSCGIDKGLICELGCGTGNVTERLFQKGFDMIGIDNAPQMLELAEKKKEAAQSDSLYLCQDMREFELYGTVDAVISVCDSINYILNPDELLSVFRLVNNYLETDGIFVFDFHTKHYYKNVVADATIAEDREDISFIWDNYYDDETDINELYLSLFLPVSAEEAGISVASLQNVPLYRKFEEQHLQRGYTLEEMQALVEKSGLIPLHAYDAFTEEDASEQSERICMVCREHTPGGAKKELSDMLHATENKKNRKDTT